SPTADEPMKFFHNHNIKKRISFNATYRSLYTMVGRWQAAGYPPHGSWEKKSSPTVRQGDLLSLYAQLHFQHTPLGWGVKRRSVDNMPAAHKKSPWILTPKASTMTSARCAFMRLLLAPL